MKTVKKIIEDINFDMALKRNLKNMKIEQAAFINNAKLIQQLAHQKAIDASPKRMLSSGVLRGLIK
jgi:hypothetical protein